MGVISLLLCTLLFLCSGFVCIVLYCIVLHCTVLHFILYLLAEMGVISLLLCTMLFLCWGFVYATPSTLEPSRSESGDHNLAKIAPKPLPNLRKSRGLFSGIKKRIHRKKNGQPKRTRHHKFLDNGVPKGPSNIDRVLQASQTGTELFGHIVQLQQLQQQQQRHVVQVAPERDVKVRTIYVAPKQKVAAKKNSGRSTL